MNVLMQLTSQRSFYCCHHLILQPKALHSCHTPSPPTHGLGLHSPNEEGPSSWSLLQLWQTRPLLQPVPLDIRRGAKGARLGPAARLGPQPPGVRLTHGYVHRGIDDEILAKGRKSP